MSIVVYYLDLQENCKMECFSDIQLLEALKMMEHLRKGGNKHVTISTNFEQSVTKAGCDEVDADYQWTKRRDLQFSTEHQK